MKKFPGRHGGSAIGTIAAALLMSMPSARAADTPSKEPEDIIVTASKFGSNLDKAPVAVSALSAEQLERANITNVK